jgi:uncharacterized protein (TIGR02270 family)
MNAAVIPVIIEQHAEEAAFLWILRSNAVHAPHYKLKDLTKLDGRVEAHLDGLRIAGAEGWRLCAEGLTFGEAGEVFAAAVLALESRDTAKIDQVLAVAEQFPDSVAGLVSALGWVEPHQLSGTVKELLSSPSSLCRRVGIAACAVHRVNPGQFLDNLLRAENVPIQLQARALRAVGELKRRDLIYDLRNWLRAKDDITRFWAAWAAVLLGDRGEALETLKAFVVTGSPFATRALPVVLRAIGAEASASWLKGLAQYPELQRDVVIGTGVIGDPRYVPWLIKRMEVPELARVAGESFSLITGVDIAYEDLDGDGPDGFEAGPSEEPEDENVALDPDENLPWPDPRKIHGWWETHKNRFQIGTRYLAGAPITESQCRNVLREGYQRQRAAAALELALMKPDAPLFEVRAPGWRQQRLLKQPS